jgi:hypothetical protein
MDERMMTLMGRIIGAVDDGDVEAERAAREELERVTARPRPIVRPVSNREAA